MSGLLHTKTNSSRSQWDDIFAKNQVIVSLSLEPGFGQDITIEYGNEEFLRNFQIVSNDDYVDNVLWQPNSQDLLRGAYLKSILFEDPIIDDLEAAGNVINSDISGFTQTHQRVLHLVNEAMITGVTRNCYALMRRKDGEPMFCHMSIIPLTKGSMDAEVDYLCMKGKYERKAEETSEQNADEEERGSRRKKRKAFLARNLSQKYILKKNWVV